MAQNTRMKARVVGEVFYREGDGPLLPVPRGAIDVETTGQDAVLSWTQAGGENDGEVSANVALPLTDYRRHVAEGAIQEEG